MRQYDYVSGQGDQASRRLEELPLGSGPHLQLLQQHGGRFGTGHDGALGDSTRMYREQLKEVESPSQWRHLASIGCPWLTAFATTDECACSEHAHVHHPPTPAFAWFRAGELFTSADFFGTLLEAGVECLAVGYRPGELHS